MGRSTVHYADNETNNILKRLHNKLRPAGTPVERVEYIIELLLLRIFEVRLKQDDSFAPLRKLFGGENYRLLFSHLLSLTGEQVLSELNKNFFPFYASILSKSREVFNKNLPTKIQDQLVLMEEVFANSNFTNNVKGGVVAEVIGLVNEIEESKILKTDLLGDAIESALSEAGGTQELGLYRTPDHIRKMMVEMVDPDFTDIIFDPSCGTAGFLFNAFEYVMDKAKKSRKFPSENIANQFYRVGLSGIEYQGRIRKMAAVNMYIRGLNPHNIEQGDSLKMYDPSRDAGSKSIVIANPPFGAERDQPSYPNVWEDYSKESETTILFVKLMFDLVKKGGRCAVIVSEGFLTWGQNSACSLRKMLLQEANLRAIISLPQGVFVSKNGQGAKTSILYFEKGRPTDFVWYYKIENDGFSMGTNRKPIEDSQIPELLKMFKEVKLGKKPRDSKFSFCIPREWIETLDPRVAERIKNEIEIRLKAKNKTRREKLVEDLDEKISKNKISKAMYKEKIWQFDNVVESQVENEVAKAIEKAHAYNFDLQNYRGSLNEEQVKDWHATLREIEAKNGSSVEKKYHALKGADSNAALQILASFDVRNELHMDIAREYLSKLGDGVYEKNVKLKKLKEIIRKGVKYPVAPLKDLIVVNDEKIKPSSFAKTEFTILGVSNQTGVFINEKQKGEEIKQAYFKVYKNQFCYNPYRINVGSIGLCEFDIENQIISGAYNIFGCNESELNPEYLDALFKTNKFLDYVNEKANGGVRMDFKIEDMQKWLIPLPPLEVQNEIIEKIKKQKQVILGAESIEESWNIDEDSLNDFPKESLSNLIFINEKTVDPRKAYGAKEFIYVDIESIKNGKGVIDYSQKIVGNEAPSRARRIANQGDVVISTVRPYLKGFAYIDNKPENVIFSTGYAILNSKDKEILDNKFLFYLFFGSKELMKQMTDKMEKGSYPSINQENIENFKIPLPPIKVQHQIVEKLDRQMQALEGIGLLKSEARKRIEDILVAIWGDKSKNK